MQNEKKKTTLSPEREFTNTSSSIISQSIHTKTHTLMHMKALFHRQGQIRKSTTITVDDVPRVVPFAARSVCAVPAALIAVSAERLPRTVVGRVRLRPTHDWHVPPAPLARGYGHPRAEGRLAVEIETQTHTQTSVGELYSAATSITVGLVVGLVRGEWTACCPSSERASEENL